MAIADECNQQLEKVLSRDQIRIEKIDHSLKLRNQEEVSIGQTLSVGYTFLTTLLIRGQHQFPLIVDSPANILSMETRQAIAKLIPTLCKQFVAFTIPALLFFQLLGRHLSMPSTLDKKSVPDLESLVYYAKKFERLRVDFVHGIASHKPILLLSVIEQIRREIITENKIYLSHELTQTFLKYWSYLGSFNHNPDIARLFSHEKQQVLASMGKSKLCKTDFF